MGRRPDPRLDFTRGSVALAGASSLIMSVQRGVVSIPFNGTSATSTIAAVNPDNCRLIFLNTINPSDANGPSVNACRVELTNSTTVTAFVNSTAASTREVGFEVIEYMPGVLRRVQRGTISTSGATSGAATITAVDMAKTTLDPLGFTSTSTVDTAQNCWFKLILTNATTVTGNGLSAITRTAGFQITEWM